MLLKSHQIFGFFLVSLYYLLTTEAQKLSIKCRSPKLRKEIRELTNEEYFRYINAIKKLHSRPWKDRLSQYERFSKTHVENKPYAHSRPAFLPWHRRFIREYELALQKIDPRIILPYWDWTLDSDEPHLSPVLSSKYMGGNGNSSIGWCIGDGPFSNFNLNFPDPHCLKRSYNNGDKIKSFATTEQFVALLNEKNFSFFSRRLELYHGGPHNGIGAYPGDFAPMHSPNDPIFFLHHCFIDMIWWQWQQKFPESDPYDGKKYRKTVHGKDMLPPFKTSAESTFDTEHPYYCYKYPEYPRRIQVATPGSGSPGARTVRPPRIGANPVLDKFKGQTLDELLLSLKYETKKSGRTLDLKALLDKKLGKVTKVPQLAPLPKKWLEENGFDEEEAREEEDKANQLSTLLATMPNFEAFNAF
ncbi:Di-copper centre-containing protein [Neoconidiobolus thromboides FSU 785]|nr:Di-copper centre-containing protein [Neoconidiobolus thromboides FSU 785]